MPFRQLKSFLKILIGVQYNKFLFFQGASDKIAHSNPKHFGTLPAMRPGDT